MNIFLPRAKNFRRVFFAVIGVALLGSVSWAGAGSKNGGEAESAAEVKKQDHPPLGLPRLNSKAKPNKPAPLAPESFTVDPLALPSDPKAADGIRAVQRDSLRVLEIDSAREWKSPLRKSGKEPICASFLLYASDATVVAIDGAWIGIAQSSVASCLQLMVGESTPAGLKWREAGLHVLRQTYGGASMAAFPVLTVRLDPKAEVWDLYAGSAQLADNIPLAKPKGSDANAGNVLVRAGTGKVWLCGLVQTGDNPLFEDANGNGIDDEFERTKKGGLLPANLAAAERAAAAKEWRVITGLRPAEAWLVEKPRPD